MLMKSDLRKLKNWTFFSMVQLLVVITIVFNGIKNRDFFGSHFNDHQKLDHRKKSTIFEVSQI